MRNPRIHQRLQSIIAMLLHESDFVKERLLTAETREEIIEVFGRESKPR